MTHDEISYSCVTVFNSVIHRTTPKEEDPEKTSRSASSIIYTTRKNAQVERWHYKLVKLMKIGEYARDSAQLTYGEVSDLHTAPYNTSVRRQKQHSIHEKNSDISFTVGGWNELVKFALVGVYYHIFRMLHLLFMLYFAPNHG